MKNELPLILPSPAVMVSAKAEAFKPVISPENVDPKELCAPGTLSES